MRRNRIPLVPLVLSVIVMVVLAACQPVMPESEMPENQSAAMSDASQASDMPAADLMLGDNQDLGEFVVDGGGMTLYMFLRDEPGVSNCYDSCAERWPPLLVEGDSVVVDGLDEGLVGTAERTDGTMQATYNGWPLYYWYEDTAPGDTLGQSVGDVWFVLSPAGDIVGYAPPDLTVGNAEELGEFVADGAGMTLYMFVRDEPGVSNCYDSCAERWPPLLVEGDSVVVDGLDEGLVGTAERTDGTMQATYNGWPLYYWYEDAAPGDTLGQAVGDVWYVLSPAGEPVQ